MEQKDTARARVDEELKELNERKDKLRDFMGKSAYLELSDLQRILLAEQYSVMCLYADILLSRSIHWDDKK